MRQERILRFGRKAAEARMTDTCDIGYETKSEKVNPATGKHDTEFTATYSGVCRFKAGNTAAGEIDAQGQLLVEQDQSLSLPIATSTAVRKNMVVRITSSKTDPGLPGTRARIKAPAVGSDLTARRFSLEVTS